MKKLLFLFLLSTGVFAQKKPLVFREVWIWEYTDTEGTKQELAIYHLPAKNYWLFIAEAYGNSGEMIEYILAKPDGEYIMAYTDAEGQNGLLKTRIPLSSPKVLPSAYRLQKKTHFFGDPELGYPKILGKQYIKTFENTSDAAEMYLTDTKSDMRPVYHFNQLEGDAKLPVHFPLDLPAHTQVLEEKIKGEVRYTFKFKSQTEYYVYRY